MFNNRCGDCVCSRWEQANAMDVSSSAFNFAPFVAGILAGANGVIVGHPFDTLKTRFQVGKILKSSTMDCKFLRQLYRGIVPPLCTSGAIQSVNFFFDFG